MTYVNVGAMVQALRKAKGISRKKLAAGILSPASLSRFEQGEQNISREKFELLVNRLGHYTHRFFVAPLSHGDFVAYELRDAFDNALAKNNTKEMESIIAKMEQMPEFETILHKQHLLINKACILLRQTPKNNTLVKKLLYEAISLSIPNFEINLIPAHLLGMEDKTIINMLASIAFEEGDGDKAIEMLEKLVHKIKMSEVDSFDKARSLTQALYNLSKFLGIRGHYQEALVVCNDAIETGREFQVYGNMPSLLFNKAFCFHHLNKHNEVAGLIMQAYYMATGHGDDFTANAIKQQASTSLNIKMAIIT